MTVEAFRAEHLAELLGHDREQERAEHYELASDAAYTIRADGHVLICGGVIEASEGKGVVWSFVSPTAMRYPQLVHRTAIRFIRTLRYRRLEATCKSSFTRGCRWLRALGFEFEGTMRAWAPDGSDHDLFARVN